MKKDNLLKAVKQAILQQAIQGKLTADWRAQHTDTEPASELLKRIKAEKQKLIAEKKIRKEKPLPPITQDEIPFELPDDWVWCRLGEIIVNSNNLNIHKEFSDDTLINYVDIDAVDNKSYKIKKAKTLPVKQLSSRARRVLKKDYILYSLVRPYLNNLAIIEDEKENYIGSTGLAVFDCLFIENKYIFWTLLTKYIENIYLSLMDGFNSPSITHDQFKNTIIPLPPLAEQKVIVEKVEKLMQQAEAISQGAHFKDFEIIDAKAYQLLKEYYYIKNMLDEIRKQKQNIIQLKQSILQEAIQGKLTEDWRKQSRKLSGPDTEPASELLKRIKAEKQKLIKEKKIRKEKPLPPITQDEIPFELPDGWVWCRFVDTAFIVRGGSPRPIGNYITTEKDGINWIKIGDTKNNSKYIYTTQQKIKKEGLKKSRYVEPGDFLLTNSMSFGKPYIMRTTGCIHDGWLLIKTPKSIINEDYLYYMLSSEYTYKSFKESARGGVVQNLNIDKVKETIIPIPPLAEQKAIVEKVENLMQKVSAMEEAINQSEQNAQMLMQAVLKEAFEGKKEEVEYVK